LATVKHERDWVVSYGIMYGGSYLLNIPSEAVIPTLQRIGKRLPAGGHWPRLPVKVQTVGKRTLAYADTARVEDPYPVCEGEIIYDVSHADLVPYASDSLIAYWYTNGFLPNLTPHQVQRAVQLSEHIELARFAADKLRDLVTAEKIAINEKSLPEV
jgi:hypothetical protein